MYHNKKKKNSPVQNTIYGVKIDTTNPSPDGALTYTDGAVGLIPAVSENGVFNAGSWQDRFPFNQIKPCMLKNGVVQYYLNPNDYNQKEDGSPSVINIDKDGDVMVEFPKIYWKIETIGTDIYIKYSDTKVDDSYFALAHTKAGEEKDKIYISAYLSNATVSSGRLVSLSGRVNTKSYNIGTMRDYAQSIGLGYDQIGYYQAIMLQILFLVMFKNRDSQKALGLGAVNNSSTIASGGSNSSGMFYGENTGTKSMKFCGLEDVWGNGYYYVDGLYVDGAYSVLTADSNYNNSGAGYKNSGTTTEMSYRAITQTLGSTYGGFMPVGGSTEAGSQYYTDYTIVSSYNVYALGANFNSGLRGGIFSMLGKTASNNATDTTARFVYM